MFCFRYKDQDPLLLNFNPTCQHREGRFECRTISKNILAKAKRNVFLQLNKTQQDKRLSFLMDVTVPKRERVRGNARKNKRHRVAVKYFLLSSDRRISVCSDFFKKLFGVGQRRLNTIAEGIKTGRGVIDKRGGDHKVKTYAGKRKKVYEFIANLKACESHYSRNKSQRLYLPSSLNINKLFKQYNTAVSNELKVKKTFFTKIFETKFNLGFGSPACDTCSYCQRTRTEIHNCQDAHQKQSLMANLMVHKTRAKAFHKLMKENPFGSVTYVFDLQQVQPIPKLSIGEAFYARQISLYCFCVTDVASQNPVFYMWNETQAGRGAQEISSALIDFLKKSNFDETITSIRLFADGCGGQNKNQHVIHALTYWLQKESPQAIKEISLYFPVRGHSYLPADRIFGRVEKSLRKVEEILVPSDYYKIYGDVANNIRVLDRKWDIRDYKIVMSVLKKIDRISEMKRIFLKTIVKTNNETEVKIKMEATYRYDDITKTFSSLSKRGHNINRDLKNLEICPLQNNIKEKKVVDVINLLKARFGEDWEENVSLSVLQFYENAVNPSYVTPATEEEQNILCDCLEEETELKHV